MEAEAIIIMSRAPTGPSNIVDGRSATAVGTTANVVPSICRYEPPDMAIADVVMGCCHDSSGW